MTMTRQQAFDIGGITHKLRLLYDKAESQDDKDKIQQQMDRLAPYIADAAAIVIRETDADFAQLADALAKDTAQLDKAIADIRQTTAGIAEAAKLINGLVAALGAVAG